MWAAIIGDTVGSAYNGSSIKGYTLPLLSETSHFTNDTVMLVATADAILQDVSFDQAYRRWMSLYPQNEPSSELVGDLASIARTVPIGKLLPTLEDALQLAQQAVSCTHRRIERIQEAQLVAKALHLATHQVSTPDIIRQLEADLGHALHYDLDALYQEYTPHPNCRQLILQAIFIGLTSHNHEDCLRSMLYIGATSPTMIIASSINQAIHQWNPNHEFPEYCEPQLRDHAPDLLAVVTASQQVIEDT